MAVSVDVIEGMPHMIRVWQASIEEWDDDSLYTGCNDTAALTQELLEWGARVSEANSRP